MDKKFAKNAKYSISNAFLGNKYAFIITFKVRLTKQIVPSRIIAVITTLFRLCEHL